MRALLLLFSLLAGTPAVVAADFREIGLPVSTWAMAIDLQGFAARSDEIGKDWRSRKVFLEHADRRTRLTLVLKPAAPGATAAAVRDERLHELEKIPGNHTFETSAAEGQATFQDVNDTTVEGKPLRMRNVHRFWVHEGTQIEAHVSAAAFTSDDDARIRRLLDSVRVPSPARAPSYTSSTDGFALDLPKGWTAVPGGPSGLELHGNGETVSVTFHPSQPDHWTLPYLMQAQQEAMERMVPDARPTRTVRRTGWSGEVEVRVYPAMGEAKVSPFVAAVTLERGGVAVLGLLRSSATAEIVADILASVRSTGRSR